MKISWTDKSGFYGDKKVELTISPKEIVSLIRNLDLGKLIEFAKTLKEIESICKGSKDAPKAEETAKAAKVEETTNPYDYDDDDEEF